MKILAIETSCDDTAIALLEGTGEASSAHFSVLGNASLSQIDLHRPYGGVYPTLAKREHAKNLIPILIETLRVGGMYEEKKESFEDITILSLFEREPELQDAFSVFIQNTARPDIDAIAVTNGPGLAPALWVGVNLARALSRAWNIPLVPINHMEGHALAGLIKEESGVLVLSDPPLPLLTLLISGGHTELVLMNPWLSYSLVGITRDDAVGEAFDKVARMLNLPYPGGPEISKLAEKGRNNEGSLFTLPRPMLNDGTCDFSWSGLKTAVLYLLKAREELNEEERAKLAEEFEDVVAEVLWKKTARALTETGARSLSLGGGVSANTHIRRVFTKEVQNTFPDVAFSIPPASLTTDNAIMIGIAGYLRAIEGKYAEDVRADANLRLT